MQNWMVTKKYPHHEGFTSEQAEELVAVHAVEHVGVDIPCGCGVMPGDGTPDFGTTFRVRL